MAMFNDIFKLNDKHFPWLTSMFTFKEKKKQSSNDRILFFSRYIQEEKKNNIKMNKYSFWSFHLNMAAT